MKGLYINIDGTSYRVDVPLYKLSKSYMETDKYYIYYDPTNTQVNDRASRITGSTVYGNIFIVEKTHSTCIIL